MSFSVLAPTDEHLRIFRDELWKEKRLLEVIERSSGTRLFRKHFENRFQVESELQNIAALRGQLPSCVPEVLGDAETYIDLQYIEGARVFTLLAMLRNMESVEAEVEGARRELLDRCVATCSQVQRILVQRAGPLERRFYRSEE